MSFIGTVESLIEDEDYTAAESLRHRLYLDAVDEIIIDYRENGGQMTFSHYERLASTAREMKHIRTPLDEKIEARIKKGYEMMCDFAERAREEMNFTESAPDLKNIYKCMNGLDLLERWFYRPFSIIYSPVEGAPRRMDFTKKEWEVLYAVR